MIREWTTFHERPAGAPTGEVSGRSALSAPKQSGVCLCECACVYACVLAVEKPPKANGYTPRRLASGLRQQVRALTYFARAWVARRAREKSPRLVTFSPFFFI